MICVLYICIYIMYGIQYILYYIIFLCSIICLLKMFFFFSNFLLNYFLFISLTSFLLLLIKMSISSDLNIGVSFLNPLLFHFSCLFPPIKAILSASMALITGDTILFCMPYYTFEKLAYITIMYQYINGDQSFELPVSASIIQSSLISLSCCINIPITRCLFAF